MPDFVDKALSIVPGDIVSTAVGRGWRRAKVIKTLGDGMLLLKFKDGNRAKVSAEHVLTEEESKDFKKSHSSTAIVRDKQVSLGDEHTDEDDTSDTVEKSGKKGIFGKLG